MTSICLIIPSKEVQTSQKSHVRSLGRRCFCSRQVFGIFRSPEQSSENEAQTLSEFSPDVDESREQHSQTSGGEVKVNAPSSSHHRLEYELILRTGVRTNKLTRT